MIRVSARRVRYTLMLGLVTTVTAGCCYMHLGAKPTFPVSYKVNSSFASNPAYRTAVSNAGASWIDINDTGLTSTGVAVDSQRVVGWKSFGVGSSTLAEATPDFIVPATCTVTSQDVGFNPLVTWSTAATTPAGSFDMETVALHEFGHWGVLLHTDCLSVMKPFYAGTKRSPTACDAAGMNVGKGTHNCNPGLGSCVNILWLIYYYFWYYNPWGPYGFIDGQQILSQAMNHQAEFYEIKSGDQQLNLLMDAATSTIESEAAVGYPSYGLTIEVSDMIWQVRMNASTEFNAVLWQIEDLVWSAYFYPM